MCFREWIKLLIWEKKYFPISRKRPFQINRRKWHFSWNIAIYVTSKPGNLEPDLHVMFIEPFNIYTSCTCISHIKSFLIHKWILFLKIYEGMIMNCDALCHYSSLIAITFHAKYAGMKRCSSYPHLISKMKLIFLYLHAFYFHFCRNIPSH